MDGKQIQSHILSRLIARMAPAAPLFGFLAPDDAVVGGIQDPETVAAELTSELGTEALLDSGVLVTASEGRLVISPVLQAGPMLALRDESGLPFALLTPAGGLGLPGPPALQILRDQPTQKLLAQNDQLCLTFSLEDAVVLRACGYPACPAAGLDELSIDDMRMLCKQFGFPIRLFKADEGSSADGADSEEADSDEADADEADAGASGPRLTFVTWSPGTLAATPPARLEALCEHWRRLQKHLSIDLDEVVSWQPDPALLEQLTFFRSMRHVEALRAGLMRCTQSLASPFAVQRHRGSALLNYAEALARLSEHSNAAYPRLDEWKHDLATAHQLMDKDVAAPLRHWALLLGPADRCLALQLAELAVQFHGEVLSFHAQAQARLAEGKARSAAPDSGRIKNLIALAHSSMKLAQAIRGDWMQYPTRVVEASLSGAIRQ
jgi:hypothetical protein